MSRDSIRARVAAAGDQWIVMPPTPKRIRPELVADETMPDWKAVGLFVSYARQDIPALLAVADAAADVLGWLRAAYPPASPMDALIEALKALEALP